jgi:hypothetical protein
MQIRAYADNDLDQLRKIHARQGFAYPFPDLSDPLFMTKLVLVGSDRGGALGGAQPGMAVPLKEPEQGSAVSGEQGIVGAALLRLTAEAYLLLDKDCGSPRERWQCLLTLHEATRREALARGLEDVHAWLPPEIATRFGRRLTQLGWVRDDAWTPFCRRLR